MVNQERNSTGDTLGSIEIDGVRIDDLGLHISREKIFYIPQDPTLLNGNLIFNIDP